MSLRLYGFYDGCLSSFLVFLLSSFYFDGCLFRFMDVYLDFVHHNFCLLQWVSRLREIHQVCFLVHSVGECDQVRIFQ